MILLTDFSYADHRFEGHKSHTEKSSVDYPGVEKSAPTRYE